MIYIVGFTFKFRPQSRPLVSGPSIQEQIARSKQGDQKTSSVFDSRFIKDAKYRVSRIQPVRDGNETKIMYLFENLSYPNSKDIDILQPSTSSGDEYIAAISSSIQHLTNARKQIIAARESERD